MRLLSAEYNGIQSALESHGFSRNLFHLRKKRGWVYIELGGQNRSFSFHRKRSVTLEGNSFVEHTFYKVRYGSKTQDLTEWQDVVVAINAWLVEVKKEEIGQWLDLRISRPFFS